ncbi:hypothetical protein F5Y10DRAFT_263784 [Nemania abortiva]|nr:hypothetical protein F5Y10DRAFT_263784 [Nemania abortiva]
MHQILYGLQNSLAISQNSLRATETSLEISESSRKTSSQARNLTILASVFIPPSFVATVFGVNVFPVNPSTGNMEVANQWWALVASAVGLTMLVVFVMMVCIWSNEIPGHPNRRPGEDAAAPADPPAAPANPPRENHAAAEGQVQRRGGGDLVGPGCGHDPRRAYLDLMATQGKVFDILVIEQEAPITTSMDWISIYEMSSLFCTPGAEIYSRRYRASAILP